jgi:penicillin amidase/acyl-homoserine-lactone acylase
MTMNVRREVLRSVHGPVIRAKHGVYAIRYAGMGDIRQVEQWYRMNKAKNLDEWMDAVRMQANPSLNIGYADAAGNSLYLYNAKLPLRAPGYDYRQYLPGDTSEVVWNEFLPFDDLPMVLNPPSGFFQNCNATPFHATTGPGNPDPEAFAPEMGIEKHQSNRSLRALELFSADESITWDEFLAYKYDMQYSKDSTMAKSIATLLAHADENPSVADKDAIALLRAWDLSTRPDSNAAALAIITVNGLVKGFNDGVPSAEALAGQLAKTVEQLKTKFGRIDVPWGEVNRLVHGTADLPIGGGPDILHAVYGRPDEATGRLYGNAGDTLVLMVRWNTDGHLHSEVIHQFGSATSIESSPHYADQSPIFVQRKLRPVWLDESHIRANLEREYRPGE